METPFRPKYTIYLHGPFGSRVPLGCLNKEMDPRSMTCIPGKVRLGIYRVR